MHQHSTPQQIKVGMLSSITCYTYSVMRNTISDWPILLLYHTPTAVICRKKESCHLLILLFFLFNQFSLCFCVLSLSPFVLFYIPSCPFSLFQSVSLSQADSYPVLPYGLEEFPNGYSDLYHAAWKLWVFFFSFSSFLSNFPHFIPSPFWIFCRLSGLQSCLTLL